jgi:hypothetical protein
MCIAMGRVPEGFKLNPKLKASWRPAQKLPGPRQSATQIVILAYGTAAALEGHRDCPRSSGQGFVAGP